MSAADLVQLAIGITALIGAAVAIGKSGIWLWRVLQKLARLTDDLAGEPPRPGMPDGRPGVLDRLLQIEQGQDAMRAQLEVVASWETRLARLEAMQLAPTTEQAPLDTAAA